MFNLNIPPTSLLGIEGSSLCTTPKTPEIVNSLIAMSNPMDSYNFSHATSISSNAISHGNYNATSNIQSGTQDSGQSSCSVSPMDSPVGINSTPTVQQTCSQLIKAGLKISIQNKRKLSTCDSSSGSEQPKSKYSRLNEDCEETTDDDSEYKTTPKGLTPEDEDRRRRRRERNKIAATKCRMKKRERTQNLIKESEQLDTQNIDLKTQVRVLETERRKLLEMLQSHTLTCGKQNGFNIPLKLLQSPATKYLAELELEVNNNTSNNSGLIFGTATNVPQIRNQQKSGNSKALAQRTVIPPVSTIKFSRNNGLKNVENIRPESISTSSNSNLNNITQQIPQLSTHQQLPNGYCKASPTSHDLGFLNSPSQENMCLSSIQSNHGTQTSPATHQVVSSINHQLSDYFPNSDNNINGGDNSSILSSVISPVSAISPASTTEFVKNELVDSQSPYTTAQSAERFLFENNCDSFVDIKHAVSVLPSNHTSNNANIMHTNHINNNLLDFQTPLISSDGSITPFHEQISMKNDFLHDADLLGQISSVPSEFVDLDTGVTSAFISNGGCLA